MSFISLAICLIALFVLPARSIVQSSNMELDSDPEAEEQASRYQVLRGKVMHEGQGPGLFEGSLDTASKSVFSEGSASSGSARPSSSASVSTKNGKSLCPLCRTEFQAAIETGRPIFLGIFDISMNSKTAISVTLVVVIRCTAIQII